MKPVRMLASLSLTAAALIMAGCNDNPAGSSNAPSRPPMKTGDVGPAGDQGTGMMTPPSGTATGTTNVPAGGTSTPTKP